jgi:hypothetical protein
MGCDRFSNETRWTPPRILRHLVSWEILGWINDHYDTCWANMVMWKMGYEMGDNWWPSALCFKPYDYCGKYDGKPLPFIPDPVMIRFCDKEFPRSDL